MDEIYKPEFGVVVAQPTSLCNLDCYYCYLIDRQLNNRMRVDVAKAIATGIDTQNSDRSVNFAWHRGEPTLVGTEHAQQLINVFEPLRQEGRMRHSIQTNGTRIDQEWCDIFAEHAFSVGVSLDGPEWANQSRRSWSDQPLFDRTMDGIGLLHDNQVPFGIISVINRANIDRPEDFYMFMTEDVRPRRLSVLIESSKGGHTTDGAVTPDKVRAFWRRLYAVYDPDILPINQFGAVEEYMYDVATGTIDTSLPRQLRRRDPYPTVSWNGDVFIGAPELSEIPSRLYADGGRIVAGNVLEGPLTEIVARANQEPFVSDFMAGVRDCMDRCEYWGICGGGSLGMKISETGGADVWETPSCVANKKMLFDGMMEQIVAESL